MLLCFFFVLLSLHGAVGPQAFRRVSEAIASAVPVIGVICGVILLAIVFGKDHAYLSLGGSG
jgi:hypothetical protein